MAATVTTVGLIGSGYDASEDMDSYRGLSLEARLKDVTIGNISSMVNEVIAALDGYGLTVGSSPSGMTNLALKTRKIRPFTNQNTVVDVDLDYVPKADIPSRSYYKMGTSLKDISVSADLFGNPYTVDYTYPDPFNPAPNMAGKAAPTQVSTLSLPTQDIILEIPTIEQLALPRLNMALWTGALNTVAWNGGIPGTWKCNGVSTQAYDVSTTPTTFALQYRFQWDIRGWQIKHYFIDPYTGFPPGNLIAGVGWKVIPAYRWLNFHSKFPSTAY